MAAERVRTNRPEIRPTPAHTAQRVPPVEQAERTGAPTMPNEWLRLQRAYGNQAVQRLQQPTVLQRTPLSDDLAKVSTGKKPAEIFGLVGQRKFKDGALDAAELTAMTAVLKTVLPDPNDCWVALKVMGGKLGMSQGLTKKESGLKKDIPSLPIEVSFVQGLSNERALVIAGVHGSERQGIDVARALIDDVLKKRQPHYSVIVVPSLFPAHADPAWGVEGKRQRATQTNRNFPDLNDEVAEYKGGHALDAAGNPLKAAKDDTGASLDILAENVMLMELIDRFHPSRIISIHGTHDSSAAGVFADPHFRSPAKEKAIATLTSILAFIARFFGMNGPDAQTLKDAFAKVDESRTKNDVDLALATAYAIADKAKGAGSLKGRFTDKKQQSSPSVAGSKLYLGAGKENATWREDMDPKTGKPKPWQTRAKDKGISLGLYAPAKGISVFTVEPPVNRALDSYDGKTAEPQTSGGAVVPKADRETEIKAYADAVATVLLGPDTGADALGKQRPAPTR
jgi:hypothetical protein